LGIGLEGGDRQKAITNLNELGVLGEDDEEEMIFRK